MYEIHKKTAAIKQPLFLKDQLVE